MTADLSLVHLITSASALVQLVMLILLAASVASWTFIFQKWKVIHQARRDAREFESRFWSGQDLTELYKQVSTNEADARGMEGIFSTGFKEFVRLHNAADIDPMDVLEGAQRAMRVTLNREIDLLETNLPFLATVGSTSPYIGLFGTVWGIMNSFRALSDTNQATLAMVAPGIAEALIATAMGLFAAIPAVIAYNRYTSNVQRMINQYDNFLEEFSSILQRQAHASPS